MKKKETNVDLIVNLKNRLQNPLPGIEAHTKMMSDYRNNNGLTKPNNNTKNSAVLVLLYPHNDEIHFPIILRSTYNGTHSAQIGLPGGKVEKTDKDFIDTALREAKEEIGLNRNEVEVLGMLSPIFIYASNHLMYPVVGFIPFQPKFILDTREVAQLFEVSINELKKPEIIKKADIFIAPNIKIHAPYYDLFKQTVWGATAMVLSEFLMVLE